MIEGDQGEKETRIPKYLSFPMYVLLDLDILSASMDIMYSVHVVLLLRFAERRNFPFSTSKAAGKIVIQNISQCRDNDNQVHKISNICS